jgi:hypothetical protein
MPLVENAGRLEGERKGVSFVSFANAWMVSSRVGFVVQARKTSWRPEFAHEILSVVAV